MTANNASKLTHVYNSLKCIYEARYEDVGKPQAFAGMTTSPVIPAKAGTHAPCGTGQFRHKSPQARNTTLV